jgi:hypothetical protein
VQSEVNKHEFKQWRGRERGLGEHVAFRIVVWVITWIVKLRKLRIIQSVASMFSIPTK